MESGKAARTEAGGGTEAEAETGARAGVAHKCGVDEQSPEKGAGRGAGQTIPRHGTLSHTQDRTLAKPHTQLAAQEPSKQQKDNDEKEQPRLQ